MLEWRFPYEDLRAWKWVAPAAVNNYYVRSLLGRYGMCVPMHGLQPIHAGFARLKLISYDVVLLLGADELNDRCTGRRRRRRRRYGEHCIEKCPAQRLIGHALFAKP